ncbi:MAG: flavodoxin-dependent (E)-4-hydroxy-3-methylbut-2-enyl-diphosphate synthase [Clostridia bacterium]|nr:flavodoxin-dependent (E)-4-hydroxy-3-methylbut-2-enyl-diphosphate synthase [Clostridia bacterium]
MNYNSFRKKTRKIRVGRLFVGGDAPLTVQSMTNIPSEDFGALYGQIKSLEKCGCDIVRMTVPNLASVETLRKIKESDVCVPVVADIHFDYRLAIASAKAGADKIRINPGNIGGDERVKAVVDACGSAGIPIRIGVNSGSLEREILAKYGSPTAQALADSAMHHVSLLEKFGFRDIIVSVKSSDVRTMIQAYRLLSEMCDYPLHLGVTEAGTDRLGLVKSFVGIGSLLEEGIGDTLRISLTGAPEREAEEGRRLVDALSLGEKNTVNIVSCPTCGRTKTDLIGIVNAVEEHIGEMHPSRKITVAIMGCAVNGPGEAREADVGVACGDGNALLFRKGVTVGKIDERDIVQTIIKEANKL